MPAATSCRPSEISCAGFGTASVAKRRLYVAARLLTGVAAAEGEPRLAPRFGEWQSLSDELFDLGVEVEAELVVELSLGGVSVDREKLGDSCRSARGTRGSFRGLAGYVARQVRKTQMSRMNADERR